MAKPKAQATLDREPAVTSYGVAAWLADQGWELRSASRNSVLPSDLWVKGEARLIVLTGGRYSLLSDGQRTVVSLPDTQAIRRWLTGMGCGSRGPSPTCQTEAPQRVSSGEAKERPGETAKSSETGDLSRK